MDNTKRELPTRKAGNTGFQSSRHFTISEFANQNGFSANYPKDFVEKFSNEKGKRFHIRLYLYHKFELLTKYLL